MKRCWDNDPEKRPTANELKQIFKEWMKKYPEEEDKEKRIPVPCNYNLFWTKIILYSFFIYYFIDQFC